MTSTPNSTSPNPAPAASSTCREVPTVRVQNHPVWLWNVPQPGFPTEQFLKFARTENVNLVYLHVNPDFMGNEEEKLSTEKFVGAVNAAGMDVYALGGEPSWATEGVAGVGQAKRWAEAVTLSGVFQGVQLGVEPQQTKDYPRKVSEYTVGVVNSVNQVRTVVKEGYGEGFVVDVAVPWWWLPEETGEVSPSASNPPRPNMSTVESLVNNADSVTVVTYATTPSEINRVGGSWGAYLTYFQKPFWFASDTTVGSDTISFAGSSRETMTTVQNQVMTGCWDGEATRWEDNRFFRGFAVHDYTGWKDLPIE